MYVDFRKMFKYALLPFLVTAIYMNLSYVLHTLIYSDTVMRAIVLDVSVGLFCLLLYYCNFFIKKQKLSVRDFHVGFWILLIGIAFVLGQCAASAIYSTVGDSSFDMYSHQMDDIETKWYLLLSLLVAPFFEEIFYRGIWYGSFRKSGFPVWLALCVSGFVFAAMHGTVIHLIPTFLLSCISCLAYEYTGRIFVSMALHSLNNLMVLWLGGIAFPDLFFHPIFLIFGIGLFMICILYIGDKLNKSELLFAVTEKKTL